jgi:hypothetical protein
MPSSKAMDETRAADAAVTAGTRGMAIGAGVAIMKCTNDDDEVDSCITKLWKFLYCLVS